MTAGASGRPRAASRGRARSTTPRANGTSRATMREPELPSRSRPCRGGRACPGPGTLGRRWRRVESTSSLGRPRRVGRGAPGTASSRLRRDRRIDPGSAVVSARRRHRGRETAPAHRLRYGTPRSTSCVSTDGTAGWLPICSRTRAEAVLHEGRRGGARSVSPAIASRGGRLPRCRRARRRPTRLVRIATVVDESAARRRRPRRRRRWIRTRASCSASPALDLSPAARTRAPAGSGPRCPSRRRRRRAGALVSRWATNTIALGRAPGMTVTTLRSSTVPSPGRPRATSPRARRGRLRRLSARTTALRHRRSRVPGTRRVLARELRRERRGRVRRRAAGGSGAGSGPVVETVSRRGREAARGREIELERGAR